jgi:hypothetical protein
MAFRDDLAGLERDLADAQVPVADVLAASGVHRITWSRWKKSEFSPRLQTWEGVREAARRLIAERGVAA